METMNGKGSTRRPRQCSREQFEKNWNRTFERDRVLVNTNSPAKNNNSTAGILGAIPGSEGLSEGKC
jgi:hypothetical protein